MHIMPHMPISQQHKMDRTLRDAKIFNPLLLPRLRRVTDNRASPGIKHIKRPLTSLHGNALLDEIPMILPVNIKFITQINLIKCILNFIHFNGQAGNSKKT